MIAVNEQLAAIAARFAEQLIASDYAEIEDVLEAAAEWRAGRLPVHVFGAVGGCLSPVSGNPSSGYTRYLAMVSTAPDDPRLGALKQAVTELIRYSGFVITTKGIFAPEDIPDIPIVPAPRREAA